MGKNSSSPFTVILMYPEEYDEPEFYLEHTEATTPYRAALNVRKMAADANNGEIAAEDFIRVAVFSGHIDAEMLKADF